MAFECTHCSTAEILERMFEDEDSEEGLSQLQRPNTKKTKNNELLSKTHVRRPIHKFALRRRITNRKLKNKITIDNLVNSMSDVSLEGRSSATDRHPRMMPNPRVLPGSMQVNRQDNEIYNNYLESIFDTDPVFEAMNLKLQKGLTELKRLMGITESILGNRPIPKSETVISLKQSELSVDDKSLNAQTVEKDCNNSASNENQDDSTNVVMM